MAEQSGDVGGPPYAHPATGTPVGSLLSRALEKRRRDRVRMGMGRASTKMTKMPRPTPAIASGAASSSTDGLPETAPAPTTTPMTVQFPRRNRKKSGQAKPSQAPHIRDAGYATATALGPDQDQDELLRGPVLSAASSSPALHIQNAGDATATALGPDQDQDELLWGPDFKDCRLDLSPRDDGQGFVLLSEASSSSAPPKAAGPRTGKAAAKMHVRSGLKCHCCYLLKSECRFAQSKEAKQSPSA